MGAKGNGKLANKDWVKMEVDVIGNGGKVE